MKIKWNKIKEFLLEMGEAIYKAQMEGWYPPY